MTKAILEQTDRLSHRQIFLPAEQPGKPKHTVVGSLSLLQGIFLTQGLNRGLLHCRQILYQLNYQGSHEIYHINKIKVSMPNIDRYRKIMWKTLIHIHDKTTQETRNWRAFIQSDKSIYKQTESSLFFHKIKNKTRTSGLTISIQHCTRSFNQDN